MSKVTSNLELFKYDPETDGSQTFNIKTALNDNWDKVDAADAAKAKKDLSNLDNAVLAAKLEAAAQGGSMTPETIGAVGADAVGQPGGVAGLDAGGKVPAGQLPEMDYVPSGRKVNNKALSTDITLNAADVSAVPATRTVNGKALTADISLDAADVGVTMPSVATEAVAKAGTNNTAMMTPLRVAQSIAANGYVSGSYVGDASTKNISLGFRASVVIAAISSGFSDASGSSPSGLALNGYPMTNGLLVITSNGFEVTSSLNQNGSTYYFIALR